MRSSKLCFPAVTHVTISSPKQKRTVRFSLAKVPNLSIYYIINISIVNLFVSTLISFTKFC